MASLYLHIPFCEKKCIYCDFYSIESHASMDAFVDALCQEMRLTADLTGGEEMDTVFFGGGTPSLLTPLQLETIMTTARRIYRISAAAEITVEANPGTVTAASLRAYRSIGVNRLSIGIQSFDDDALRFLGRIHDGRQAVACVEDARRAGFANISIDLIFSLPGQDQAGWRRTLAAALDLETGHLSAYSLIVEDGTPLARMVRTKLVSPNPVDREAELYTLTMAMMEERGFEHYEVSNYARPGNRSRHNYNYWMHGNYLGLGPSAHSFWRHAGADTGRRWWNAAHVSGYISAIGNGRIPVVADEHLTPREFSTEAVFLGLRSDGLDDARFEREFGYSLVARRRPTIDQLVAHNLALLDDRALRLTPGGYLLCDEICSRLIA